MVQTPDRVGPADPVGAGQPWQDHPRGYPSVPQYYPPMPPGVPPAPPGLPPPGPPRSRRRWPLVLAGVLGTVVVLAFGVFAVVLVRAGVPTAIWQDRAPSTDVGTPTPGAQPGSEIRTASGTFTITGVVTGDRYPEDCEAGPACNIATPGYQMLLVKLVPEGDADVEDIMSEGRDVYVVSSDGERTNSFLQGWTKDVSTDAKQAVVGFIPRDSAHGFTLYWPGNPPLKLPR